jgi:hypothetical protein
VTWNHFFFFFGEKKKVSVHGIFYINISNQSLFFIFILKKKEKKKDQSLEFKTNQVVIKV